ncbi:Uncharacterised protein [Campylobacter hyointestinalis]|uniref:hypothetical protein n=1 Tax=Campylobacter hyointestinalis TaxID=198 RepID=UPI0004D42251|nr:hypothetical protein [Campylobacter hyointestinalis]ANE32662.1 hypothetical protein CHH_1009 [Campylobacter hyointestinalis subsp. hyointestinalis LMG 9260]KEA45006.1 hypothetical protein CR67_00965 [Campylobacter hyointestinalis subsp. hyointestinalis]QKF55830.1 hypothetical protein CHHT_0990 [Campylobacter hyointestinalis subsp. hyointestinalis]TWO28564.1 hypothetical protein YZ79_07900 [Campylobacter hyointestinalis]TXK48345.1 hypothetical protein A0Z69_01330 [Campylobacter hyointestinal
MIKQIFATVLLVGVLTLLIIGADIKEGNIISKSGNIKKEPLEIVLGKYLCKESNTLITDLYNTAQAVMPNGDTYFFNDIANVFIWLMRQENRDDIVVWVYSQDTQKYILAKSAWYSRDEITPMGYGFGAYEFHLYGKSDHYYDEILLCAARGETLINPLINILITENRI